MMSRLRMRCSHLAVATVGAFLSTHGATANEPRVSLNYESLSSLEEPVAWEVGDLTLLINGVLDLPYTFELDGESAYAGAGSLAHAEVSAKTQLPNRWRVGVTWFAEHAENAPSATHAQEGYSNRVALSAGGSWGRALVGNVSGVIHRQTRRLYGAGHARLRLDEAFGELEGRGAGYQVRLGPWLVGAATDQDANLDIGATFQRPAGVRDYRLTARATNGTYRAPHGEFLDSRALSGVGEFIYGSTLVDFGVGVERLSIDGVEADRWYVSSGVRHKTGVLTWSIEAHHGGIEDEPERSAALGLQYDIARGLSANLGLNYAKSSATVGNATIIDIDGMRAVASLRYGF